MAKSLNSLYPKAFSYSSEDEPARPIPTRRGAMIQTCEDDVKNTVSHAQTVTVEKVGGSV